MLHQLLIAHGLSLLVLCLILAAGISVRYADRRNRADDSSGNGSEQQPSGADRNYWFPTRRDGSKPSTVRIIVALILGAGVLIGVTSYFMHYPLPRASGVLLAPLSVIALRAMVRSGQIRNPGGPGEKDFGLRPVWDDVMRAAGCLLSGLALAAAGGLAVRYRFLSDSWSTAAFTIFPGLALVLLGVWFLISITLAVVK